MPDPMLGAKDITTALLLTSKSLKSSRGRIQINAYYTIHSFIHLFNISFLSTQVPGVIRNIGTATMHPRGKVPALVSLHCQI